MFAGLALTTEGSVKALMDRNVPLFAGIAALAILLVGTTVAFIPTNTTATHFSTSSTTTGTGSTSGLNLRLSLNASAISQGQAVSIAIEEWNSLDTQNTVASSNAWPTEGLGVGPCGPLSFPFGFEVLTGYYNSSSALSSAPKVQLYEPGVYSCPAILSRISSYSFYSLSDRANVSGSCGSGTCFTGEMNTTATVRGSWNEGSLAPLPAGTYTVVVGDEWGALLFGYFEVTSLGSGGTVILPAGTTFQVSSSYDCVAGHYELPFSVQNQSSFTGGFSAEAPGATLYVATVQQSSVLFQGHPSAWVYSTGLQNSTRFAVVLSPGSYVAWIEGANLNCGAKIVMPLERLTTVNITQAFMVESNTATAIVTASGS